MKKIESHMYYKNAMTGPHGWWVVVVVVGQRWMSVWCGQREREQTDARAMDVVETDDGGKNWE